MTNPHEKKIPFSRPSKEVFNNFAEQRVSCLIYKFALEKLRDSGNKKDKRLFGYEIKRIDKLIEKLSELII